MVERFRVVPASYVFLIRGGSGASGSVLLQLRQNTGYRDGYWAAAAAGHVESDESAFAAAVREAREEIGVELLERDLRPLTAMHRTHGNRRPIDERVDFFFSCEVWHGEPHIVEPHKSGGLEWFALAALPDQVVPHERVVLDALAAGDVPPVLAYGF
jgi:8-oxo-dGTP pyrophosphatase MutT (NUDIX family)